VAFVVEGDHPEPVLQPVDEGAAQGGIHAPPSDLVGLRALHRVRVHRQEQRGAVALDVDVDAGPVVQLGFDHASLQPHHLTEMVIRLCDKVSSAHTLAYCIRSYNREHLRRAG
jgi:hypothetical protein